MWSPKSLGRQNLVMGLQGRTADFWGGGVGDGKCGVFNTCEMTCSITVPRRETGSVSASSHQINSFLPPPAHCSGYYISHKPLKEQVIFWRKVCVGMRVVIWVLGL